MTRLAKEISDFEEDYVAGGALHIVLSDWNLEDDHIAWCLSSENPVEHSDPRIDYIGLALLNLSLPERFEVLKLCAT